MFDTDPKTTDAQDDFTPWIRDSNTDRLPRWGKSGCCPECNMSVSPMERGVVPGPGGTRWHASCLICGGKGTKPSRNKSDKPGCGKKLDSAARMDSYRRAWCQECLVSSGSVCASVTLKFSRFAFRLMCEGPHSAHLFENVWFLCIPEAPS